MKRKAKKVASKWKPIQLPKELVNDLETFANSKTAKSMGFTNKSQFAAFAIRKILSGYSESLWVYELVDVTEGKVTIIDHETDELVTMVLKDGYLVCDKHKNSICEHRDFVSGIPRVYHMIKGWKLPRFHEFTRKENLRTAKKRLS